MYKTKINTLALVITLMTQTNVYAAADAPYMNQSGKVLDDKVMYSIGGGSTVVAPTSLYIPQGMGIGISWNSDFMCGSMNLQTTIKNQLNGATDGFKDIMGNIVQAATGAVASLPAMIIQRSNPGLYELLSNGVLQARVDFDRSKLTCQSIIDKANTGLDDGSWKNIAAAESMKRSLANSSSDAVTAVQKVQTDSTKDGVPWIGGQNAGGVNQAPIKLTETMTRAGYNSLHQREPLNTSSLTEQQCKGGAVCSSWKNAQEASDFAVRVLGDKHVRTCEANCEPVLSTAGTGLLPLVQEEYDKKLTILDRLLTSRTKVSTNDLNELSSPMLPISRNVIEVLRMDPDASILSQQLLSELALSEILTKGSLLLRVLQAGGKNPHVEQTKDAKDHLTKTIDDLKTEMDSIKMELELRKMFASNTAVQILNRFNQVRDRSMLIQEDDPASMRVKDADEG